MSYLVEPDLTEQELVWVDQQIMRGRFASRADAVLALIGRALTVEASKPSGALAHLEAMSDRAEQYRRRAEEAEQMAREARDPHARTMFAEIARQWRDLAVQAKQFDL